MPQYEGLAIPFSGDSDGKTSGNAAWLQTLRRAALGRNNQTLPQDPAKTGIILSWGIQDIPQGSVIGAIGATYPGSPTAEPSPYMQAHLDRSQLTLYTLQTFAAANSYIECFAFAENEPVRIRVDYDAADTYQTGMPVGRLSGSTKIRAGGGGLLLASLPYTPDAGANYYSWVMLDKTNRWQGRCKEDIPAATVDEAETTPGTGKVYVDFLKTNEDLEVSELEITLTNRNESTSYVEGQFIEFTWDKEEWVPVAGGGISSASIWFTIDSVLCPERDYVEETTLVVTVIRHTGSCGGEAPGADTYGIYHVYAFCENDLSGLAEEDLVGSKGKATYSRPIEGECTPKYLIDFLCAQPECP